VYRSIFRHNVSSNSSQIACSISYVHGWYSEQKQYRRRRWQVPEYGGWWSEDAAPTYIARIVISGVRDGEEFSDRTIAKGVGGVVIEVGRHINNAGHVSPTPLRPLLKPSFSLLSLRPPTVEKSSHCVEGPPAGLGAVVRHVLPTFHHASSVRIAARRLLVSRRDRSNNNGTVEWFRWIARRQWRPGWWRRTDDGLWSAIIDLSKDNP